MTNPNEKTPAVYAAWAGVAEDMARGGISKNKKAPEVVGGYTFRGIDDVLIALSASMYVRKLGVRSVFRDRVVEERVKGNGKAEKYVRADADFYLHSLEDGSSVGPFTFMAEAFDSGDKATNKVMSIAYKYFAIQTFAIPTKGVLADEEPNAPDEPPAPSQRRDDKPREEQPREPVITSGEAKGTPFSKATDKQLHEYGDRVMKVLDDPAQSANRPKALAIANAIDAELQRRGRA